MSKNCPQCGYPNSDERNTCFRCGANLSQNNVPHTQGYSQNQPGFNFSVNANFGNLNDVHNPPQELKGWNWGAFSLTFFWGIANQVYCALLCLVPYVGFIVSIYFGIFGNSWAWKSGRFRTIEECMECQKVWNKWGLVFFILSIVLSVLFSIIFIVVYFWLMTRTNTTGNIYPPSPIY